MPRRKTVKYLFPDLHETNFLIMLRFQITLSSSRLLLALLVTATAFISCDQESQMDEYRRLYPIPTELPAATCTGANTLGCYVDTVLFVANYFPNLSSWGARTAEGGVRAFIEAEHPDYIQVIADHPIRPFEIDERTMRINLSYYFASDSIGNLTFSYSSNSVDYSVAHNNWAHTPNPNFNFNYNQNKKRLCGEIYLAKLAEIFPAGLGNPSVNDTLDLKDLRLDLPVHMGRY